MNNILEYIPGFRTKKLWKMIIAGLYYLLTLCTLTWGIGHFLFYISIPFIIFNIINIVKIKKSGLRVSKAVIPLVLSLILLITGAGISSDTQSYQDVSQPPQGQNSEIVAEEAHEVINTENSTIDASSTNQVEKDNQENNQEANNDQLQKTEIVKDSPPEAPKGIVKVHYIDVGQADSILIISENKSMLIDAGNNSDSTLVVNYLKQQGIKKLDVVVGTHPHEDHIGGLDAVISNFDIGAVYMPKATSTTKTFQDVVTAIKDKNLKITTPVPGSSFKLGETNCTILAPNSENYEDLNDTSIVLKAVFGDTSFIFTGDAESKSEFEMLAKSNLGLKADVLKIGHHGSSSSTSQLFLEAVSPNYAVISVGKGNDYGHPHKQTMDLLKEKGMAVYRTDQNGTIIATSDGQTIEFNCSPGNYDYANDGESTSSQPPASSTPPTEQIVNEEPAQQIIEQPTEVTAQQRTVYYTPNGKSYHYTKECPTLSRSKTILEATIQQAIDSGHADPCDKCVH